MKVRVKVILAVVMAAVLLIGCDEVSTVEAGATDTKQDVKNTKKVADQLVMNQPTPKI